MSEARSGPRVSEPRERLLRTASRLFYAKGIHAVGIEEIVAEAAVTRATLYRHFPGKEELIRAYLAAGDAEIRANVASLRASGLSEPDVVRGIADAIAGQITTPGFRGCAFLNAAAEYPDPDSPVHQLVLAHRAWFLETMTETLELGRRTPAAPAAEFFVMLRDGAMASGCLADPAVVAATFRRGVEGIVEARAA